MKSIAVTYIPPMTRGELMRHTQMCEAQSEGRIRGYETMNAIRKGQVIGIEKGDIRTQNHFISEIFGIAV